MNEITLQMKRTHIVRAALGAAGLALAAALICVVVLVRTAVADKPDDTAPLALPVPAIDIDVAVSHLSHALKFETVSFDDGSNVAALAALQAWMIETYPRFHATAQRTVIAEATLIYEWAGRDASLAPIVLMAHQDVVPIAQAERWQHPPFSGAIVDDAIWGRGALDDKGSLIAMLEAAESLIAAGHQPARTVVFVFGHDEELAGAGARTAAAWLVERKVKAAFVLDEGGLSIADNPVTGKPATVIGVAEKGYVTLQLSVNAAGGHSNAPPAETAVDTLAKAILAVREHPFPARYGGVTKSMLETMAPDAPLMARIAIANSWLFERMIVRQLSASPATDALLRTTIAPTMLQASPKQNVLASVATATINFRLLPGDSTEGVIAHVREALGDLPVQVSAIGLRSEPSAIARMDSAGYRLIAGVARSIIDAPVAPLLVLGATDSRSMRAVSDDIYRFLPIQLSERDLTSVHGIDEHLSIENLGRMITFYQRIIVGSSNQAFMGKHAEREPRS